ncbi:MAG TPA: ankyrin repeat domain-containing protein [Gallionellaceae bacterium]
MKLTPRKLVLILGTAAATLILAAGAKFGYGAWAKYQARNEIESAGATYSEASFIEQACNGNQIAVFLFLRSGMSVNVRGNEETTPLHCALKTRKDKLTALLLASGADVNAKTKSGQTPLMEAAKVGSVDDMRALLAAGAGVNAVDLYGNTPLILAAGASCSTPTCKAAAVEFLLSQGADPKLKNQAGETVISRILQYGYGTDLSQLTALLGKLIKAGADINSATIYGQPSLCYVAQQGKLDFLQKLIELGADVNAKGQRGTPLICAARWPEVVKLLLDKKANPNMPDESGATPLAVAVEQRAMESVKLLLDAGASVEPPPLASASALQSAAKVGDLELVTLMLKHTVEVNGKDARGNTALHALAQFSNGDPPVRSEIAKLLMRSGANPNLLNSDGRRPLDLALSANALNLASTLAGRKITANPLLQRQQFSPPVFQVPAQIVPMPQRPGMSAIGGAAPVVRR